MPLSVPEIRRLLCRLILMPLQMTLSLWLGQPIDDIISLELYVVTISRRGLAPPL
jgi:hypothetical protein